MNWKLTRNDTNASIEIPEDMQWLDEFGWSKVSQSKPQYSLTGAMFVFRGTKKAGRPITLGGDWAWIDRSDVVELRNWMDEPELKMTLTHPDGKISNVIFRLDENALESNPVHYQTPEADNDPYTAKIKLIKV